MGVLFTTSEAEKLTSFVASKNWPCFGCFRKNFFEKIDLIDFIVIKITIKKEFFF